MYLDVQDKSWTPDEFVRLRALEEGEQGEGWKNEGLERIKPYQCELRIQNEN